MSAHQTKSSIKADSYLQNTDTFSSRHVHFIVYPQCPRAGLHRQPSHKYTTELEAEAEEYTNHNVRFKALFLIGFSTCASNYDNLYFTGS